MKTPADKKIAFLFVSDPERDAGRRWSARVSFPQGADAESVLSVAVTDGEGRPVPSGVFAFAGRELPVADGRAELTYGDFVAGKHDPRVSLRSGGGPEIPGMPTFG